MKRGTRSTVNRLRDAGHEALSPSATRHLLACFATASPSGLIRVRDVLAFLGLSEGGNWFLTILDAFVRMGLVEKINAQREGKRPHHRYRLIASLTLYRRPSSGGKGKAGAAS